MRKKFIEIDNIVVNQDVMNTKFTCDLEKCKGACCTMESEFGAPLLEEEVKKIKKVLPIVWEYLPGKNRDEIQKNDFFEEKQGEIMTTSINNKDCVFVFYEDEIAKCGIEKAFFDGKIKFRKPISCHLFPIRIANFGGPILKYEKYSDCEPALNKGWETNLSVFEFCKDALERAFGTKWIKKLANFNGN